MTKKIITKKTTTAFCKDKLNIDFIILINNTFFKKKVKFGAPARI